MTTKLNPTDHPAGTRVLTKAYFQDAPAEITVIEWSGTGRAKVKYASGNTVWLPEIPEVVEVLSRPQEPAESVEQMCRELIGAAYCGIGNFSELDGLDIPLLKAGELTGMANMLAGFLQAAQTSKESHKRITRSEPEAGKPALDPTDPSTTQPNACGDASGANRCSAQAAGRADTMRAALQMAVDFLSSGVPVNSCQADFVRRWLPLAEAARELEREEREGKQPKENRVECHKLDTPEAVFFYEQDFYVLSNFSAFKLRWQGYIFDTSEAAYHWEKFPHKTQNHYAARAWILNAMSAHEAFKHAEKFKADRRSDWDEVKVNIMRDILRAKVQQHEYVRRKLLATGNRLLVEDSWRDDFWGWGADRKGQNMLGKLWMEIREEVRTKDHIPDATKKVQEGEQSVNFTAKASAAAGIDCHANSPIIGGKPLPSDVAVWTDEHREIYALRQLLRETQGEAVACGLEIDKLYAIVQGHHAARGMNRCWENDAELYRAFGLDPGTPGTEEITECEHRKACDEYRDGLPLKDRFAHFDLARAQAGEPVCLADGTEIKRTRISLNEQGVSVFVGDWPDGHWRHFSRTGTHPLGVKLHMAQKKP